MEELADAQEGCVSTRCYVQSVGLPPVKQCVCGCSCVCQPQPQVNVPSHAPDYHHCGERACVGRADDLSAVRGGFWAGAGGEGLQGSHVDIRQNPYLCDAT